MGRGRIGRMGEEGWRVVKGDEVFSAVPRGKKEGRRQELEKLHGELRPVVEVGRITAKELMAQ
jgi:hypothetical protein